MFHSLEPLISVVNITIISGTDKVRNSGLGLDPDQSAINGPELGILVRNVFGMPLLRLNSQN